MPSERNLRIYLEPVMLQMARAGDFGFVNKVRSAFAARGVHVDLVEDTDEERLRSAAHPGYSLFLMKDPFHPRALSMRRAYYYPFWRIEATARRWEFQVAEKTFDPGKIDTDIATAWFNRWRRYLFRKAPLNSEKSGLIYVPLQGRLLDHRSFQTMSPVEMIGEVQARAGDRRILLALHPGETYSGEEITAVERIAAGDPRVTLQTGGMDEALRLCDLVVTQNSAAALSGFFFRKPALLFGESDFHHEMPRVSQLGVDEAWRTVAGARPAFARYLYWFIQLNAIKADTDEAEARIVETCRNHGWEV
jgi:hypothetical protein